MSERDNDSRAAILRAMLEGHPHAASIIGCLGGSFDCDDPEGSMSAIVACLRAALAEMGASSVTIAVVVAGYPGGVQSTVYISAMIPNPDPSGPVLIPFFMAWSFPCSTNESPVE